MQATISIFLVYINNMAIKQTCNVSALLLPFWFFLSCLYSGLLFAQPGKDGSKTVSAPNTIINDYTTLTANASIGATTLAVVNSALNTGFAGSLGAGDLVMIIQMQGATILGTPSGNVATPADSSWGAITNYNNCGNYEFVQVCSVGGATSITLDCPLTHDYTAAGKVQVIRVPRYCDLTINSGGVITSNPWNGSTGGVVVAEIAGNTVINAGGKIDVSAKGFRGGVLSNLAVFPSSQANTASTLADNGAEKGEGIAGFQAGYNVYGGKYCRGAAANGGGGGDAHDCGGGGGANGGNPALWNGHGNPDISNAAYINAWNLEYIGFATQTSSGGGQGGYSYSNNDANALTDGPGNPAWGGDNRKPWGGIGGRPLDYSTGKIFLGGGGGSGSANDGNGRNGGAGGGMVYLLNYGTVSGAGQIISNGANGANTPPNGIDAPPGGGAGGTLIVNSVGAISGISFIANGGDGGKQDLLATEAEGCGGGGSGGYVGITNGAPAITINGGANGTTNSLALTEFPPNGATSGGIGTSAVIATQSVPVCSVWQLNANFTPVTGSCTGVTCDATATASMTTTSNCASSSSYVYIWLPGGQTTASISGLCAGTYTVISSLNAGGCVVGSGDTAIVIIPAVSGGTQPVADFCITPSPKQPLSEPVFNFCNQWIPNPGVTSWIWDFGDGDSDTLNLTPTHSYSATATQNDFYKFNVCLYVEMQSGCWDTICKTVELIPEYEFYIPNTFTPNSDELNDMFYGKCRGVKQYDIWIFDRWGNQIWDCHKVDKNTSWDDDATVPKQEGLSSSCKWDGKVQSGGLDMSGGSKQLIQEDVYVWKVELLDVFDRRYTYVGQVNVVR